MKFLRYFCHYCLARFAYDTLRRAFRRPAKPRTPHDHRAWHVLLSLALWLCAGAFVVALVR